MFSQPSAIHTDVQHKVQLIHSGCVLSTAFFIPIKQKSSVRVAVDWPGGRSHPGWRAGWCGVCGPCRTSVALSSPRFLFPPVWFSRCLMDRTLSCPALYRPGCEQACRVCWLYPGQSLAFLPSSPGPSAFQRAAAKFKTKINIWGLNLESFSVNIHSTTELKK